MLYNIIIASLKAFFHASKISGGGNRFFFFSKSRFHALHERSRNLFNIQGEDEHVQGTVKLLPKKNGEVRPLFLGANQDCKASLLRISMLLIRYLSNKEQGFKRPVGFVKQWTHALSVLGRDGPLYFVKTDIKNAFGSVSTCKLKQMLQSTLFDQNLFEDFKKLYWERKGMDIPKYEVEFYEHIFDKSENMEKGIFKMFINLLWSTIETAMDPTVTFGKQRVKLASGLPQGCCLSSDLCDFYYSKMTSTFLQDFIINDNGVLLRAVDDLLYISHNKEMAESFKDCIIRGIPEFNCFVNKAKTITNCSSQVQRILFNGYILCFTLKRVLINTTNLTKVPCRHSMAFNNKGDMKNFVTSKLLHATKVSFPRQVISESSSHLNTLQDNVWRLGLICGYKIQALLIHACDFYDRYNSKIFVGAILGVGNVVFKRILNARKELENMSKDLFCSIFICSIYCSLVVISCDSWKILTGKLKAIVLRMIKKMQTLEGTDGNKRLLNYLHHVTGKF